MDLGIDGNSAFVTAGSAGLGLASAEALAEAGADVAVCGRTGERLGRAERRLRSVTGGEADVVTIQADITEKAELAAAVETVVKEFGGLDHLVTSAGGPPPRPFSEASTAEWYDAYDLLVMSVVWAVDAAHPHLVDGGGTIVNITSRSDAEVLDDHVLSNAVRRSVGGLMKTVSREFAPAIRANAVLPGPHETQRVRKVAEQAAKAGDYDDPEAFIAEMIEDVPLERIGRPSELGDAVAWLSSERSSYITGQAIPIDGGALRSV